jgi:ribosome-binding protein aMBF1 (putative translation factor)
MEALSPRVKAIKAEIERQEIPVPDLAAAVDIAFSTLYRMLNGETDPILSNVEDLEKILRIKYKRVKR